MCFHMENFALCFKYQPLPLAIPNTLSMGFFSTQTISYKAFSNNCGKANTNVITTNKKTTEETSMLKQLELIPAITCNFL